jgi:methyl coenzyme M reductase subunit C
MFSLAVGVRLSQAMAAMTLCPVEFQDIAEVGLMVREMKNENASVNTKNFFMKVVLMFRMFQRIRNNNYQNIKRT